MVTGIYSFYMTCPDTTSYRDFQSLIPTIVPMSTRCTQGSRSCENFGPKWQRAWMWLPGSKAPTRHGHGLPLSAHLLLQLAPLQLSTLLFGKKDGPFWSRQCVTLLVPKYREHQQGRQEDPVLLDDLEKTLHQFSWVDDTLLPATTTWVLRWAQSKGFSPPSPPCSCTSPCSVLRCPTREWNEEAIHQLDLFLEHQTNLYLSQISQLAVRVSHFSGFFVKCTQSPTPNLQKLLDQEVSLKTPFDADPRLLALKQTRPTQDQIRAEVFGGCHPTPLNNPPPLTGDN